MKKQSLLLLATSTVFYCSDSSQALDTASAASPAYKPALSQTLALNDVDNVETVKFIGQETDALVLSSKTRKLSRLNTAPVLIETRSSILDTLTDEGETTTMAVSNSGQWAAIARTVINTDDSDAIVDCSGLLYIVNIEDNDQFGSIVQTLDVGPMPDAVAISADDSTILVGNERDVVWGKCENVTGLDPASISVLSTDDSDGLWTEEHRILLDGDLEPEGIAMTPGGQVAITMQDTHQVATFNLSDLNNELSLDLSYSDLSPNPLGQDAWPDGITAFNVDEDNYFAIAGEGNDIVYIVDADGETIKELWVTTDLIPGDFPRDGTWGPLFRPDSIASFRWNESSFIATSLKASGAIGIWEVNADVEGDWNFDVIKVGLQNELGIEGESSVQTEGVTAHPTNGSILAANEKESSVSIIRNSE